MTEPTRWDTITGYARRSEAGLELFLAGRTESDEKIGARFRMDWRQLAVPGAVSDVLDKMTAELEARGCS